MIDCFFHAQKGGLMAFYKYKGKRIRASDKSLVFRFSAGSLMLLFAMMAALFNLKTIVIKNFFHITVFFNQRRASQYNFQLQSRMLLNGYKSRLNTAVICPAPYKYTNCLFFHHSISPS